MTNYGSTPEVKSTLPNKYFSEFSQPDDLIGILFVTVAASNSEAASEMWATARRLAELLPGEKTERAWLDHAKRDGWVSRKVEPGGRGRGANEFLLPPDLQAQIRQRLLQRSFEQFRTTVASGEPHTTAMLMFVEDYNRHQGTCDYVDGVEQITLESLEAALRLPKGKMTDAVEPAMPRPAPSVERAVEALANPRGYMVQDRAAHPYEAPDYALLETLIRFAEGRLTRNITPTLLDKVDQVVEVWSPVAAGRPDLAARLARIKASVDLLRLE